MQTFPQNRHLQHKSHSHVYVGDDGTVAGENGVLHGDKYCNHIEDILRLQCLRKEATTVCPVR